METTRESSNYQGNGADRQGTLQERLRVLGLSPEQESLIFKTLFPDGTGAYEKSAGDSKGGMDLLATVVDECREEFGILKERFEKQPVPYLIIGSVLGWFGLSGKGKGTESLAFVTKMLALLGVAGFAEQPIEDKISEKLNDAKNSIYSSLAYYFLLVAGFVCFAAAGFSQLQTQMGTVNAYLVIGGVAVVAGLIFKYVYVRSKVDS